MASNPIGKCCVTGFKHEGTPAGKLESSFVKTELGEVEAYITTPPADKDKKQGLLFIPDVIGHTAINAQLLADSFAAQGYMVVLPDLFFGDFIEMNNFANVDLGRWKEGAYSKQGIAHDPASIDPVVAKCIAKMRSELGLREVGALGYCFGAKYVVRFLVGEGEQKPAAEVLDAGFLAHPSFVDEAELRAVKGPVSIAASEIDSIFTAPLRHKSEEILAEIGVPWQICLYGSVSHGFAVRGDLKDRRLKFAMEQAFKQAVDWFREWME